MLRAEYRVPLSIRGFVVSASACFARFGQEPYILYGMLEHQTRWATATRRSGARRPQAIT